ncbi:aldehyde dehydrogenase family protein [Cupriavidus lacunae]|uniref:Aldehyde dehydrogenase n=1 Tax=Cupriavidus lacunae TaxID=2666307 RepID=A0A370P1S9_9BURK|nr:aldehyde dehydrogenase family protein [Cupriavidus lacunae]RDK11787.1 aldehyde dehydrogenase [Cupriavidus lacunae]
MGDTAGFSMTIDGKAAPTLACFDVLNPATERVVAEAPDASPGQLDEAVASARRAAPAWAALPLQARQQYVVRIGETITANLEELAQLLMREQGKPLAQARQEVQRAAYWCAEMARLELPVETVSESATEQVRVLRVPLGVVGGIVPWNFPLALAMWKVAPALLTGNTMVLKPSPFTPLTTLKLGELLRDVLPAGVLNVISGTDALGPLMSAHPGIDKLSFTGSTVTGRAVMASAAVNLKRLTLELGGNDAAIVLPDADVEAIAPAIFWGAFANSAQFCLAIKRLYIHEDVYDRLAGELVRLAQETRVGPGDTDGVQLGPVQNRRQFERLKDLLEDTRTAGHRILAGGDVAQGHGYFFPVTLVDNPPDTARVVREEPFGPILPLLRFRDVDDAIARANDSEYGLGGSVWGRDAEAAMQVALQLNTGTVWVNQIHTIGPDKPMAGHKQSGVGIENGVDGLLEYTVPRTVSLKRPHSTQPAHR